MARSFNTTGPCIPGEHYMLPPEGRCPGVMDLIEDKHFFVIHAPRQSGKTTLLKDLARQINAGIRYHALYCSLESVQGIHENPKGTSAILNCLDFALKYHPGLRNALPGYLRETAENTAVRAFLTDLAQGADRPVVVFFDETDCLGGETLVSFLRQLRDGYINRAEIPFISSLALVGMRNIRDYRVQVRPDVQTLGTASPFNIAKEARTLKYFDRDEIAVLYQQHTNDTGQSFPTELVSKVFEMTQGQPWLVNAIAAEMVEKLTKKDASQVFTVAMAEEAAQRIILRRDTHIDSLLERLQEERVRKIIEPVLLGEGETIQRQSNEFQLVWDLGLLREDRGTLRIANPMYNEVIARTLNADMQLSLPETLIRRWMDGHTLEMSKLLKSFQEFWRDNSEIWIERFQYKEAAPHLILMGFLQRVINGGAKIDREFATGTRRVDICVHYAGKRYPVELKIVRNTRMREEGLAQLVVYMDSLGAKEGWLLLFDTKSSIPWEQRINWETIIHDGRTLHVVGV
jgi:hypothetical protein